MSRVVNITEAKTRFSALVARAQAGEPVLIGRVGRPVALTDDPGLSGSARRAITNGRNRVLVSAWEIAIKTGLGKLEAPDDLPAQLAQRRFTELDVTMIHALAVAALPATMGTHLTGS